MKRQFSTIPTSIHAASHLITHKQSKEERLQEFIFELFIVIVYRKESDQIADPFKVTLFSKHIHNCGIQSKVNRYRHRTLKATFHYGLSIENTCYFRRNPWQSQTSWPFTPITQLKLEWLECVGINVNRNGI